MLGMEVITMVSAYRKCVMWWTGEIPNRSLELNVVSTFIDNKVVWKYAGNQGP